MDGALLKRQRVLVEMMGAAGPVTKGVKVKKEDEIREGVDVTRPAASPRLGL